MYAVITEGRLSYLGECQDQALATFNAKPNSTLHSVEDHEELDVLLQKQSTKTSDVFDELIEKLDELGINEDFADKIRDNGVKLVGEVKSLGIKGMQAVGEGFVALGELLRKSSEETDSCDSGCCRKNDSQ